MLFLMWAAGGWCGTPFPRWWWGPKPPHPDPEPWLLVKIVSIIGGLAGGWMTQRIVGGDLAATTVLTTIVGAVVFGGLLGGIAGLAAGRGKAAGN